jgi:hypothetical protein
MTVIAHHAGEELLLTAAIGSGMVSTALLVLRARMAEFARRRRRARP